MRDRFRRVYALATKVTREIRRWELAVSGISAYRRYRGRSDRVVAALKRHPAVLLRASSCATALHYVALIPGSFVVLLAGMRGAEVPGRGLSPVDELRRQVPLDLPDQEVPAAAARHRLSPAGVKTTRDVAARGRGSRFLHGQFHHFGRSLGK